MTFSIPWIKNLVGNQRNVTIAANEKSIGGIYPVDAVLDCWCKSSASLCIFI